MGKHTQKFLQEREELNRLYNAPTNKGLKYSAFIVIAIVIVLMLVMIIWMQDLSTTAILIMRGCAGIGAIIFVVLVGILAYRVNSQHIKNKNDVRFH